MNWKRDFAAVHAVGDFNMSELLTYTRATADVVPIQADMPEAPIDLATSFIRVPRDGKGNCVCVAI